jgi:hypothetical protein
MNEKLEKLTKKQLINLLRALKHPMPHKGIGVRDEFAKAALTGILSALDGIVFMSVDTANIQNFKLVAKLAYIIADDMIEARGIMKDS